MLEQIWMDVTGDLGRLPVRELQASAETEASVREVMIAAGITPPVKVVAKTQQIY